MTLEAHLGGGEATAGSSTDFSLVNLLSTGPSGAVTRIYISRMKITGKLWVLGKGLSVSGTWTESFNMIFDLWVNRGQSCKRRPLLPQLVDTGQTLFSFRVKMMAGISTQLCLNWYRIGDTWILCDKWSLGTQVTRWAPLLTQRRRGLTSACAQPLSSAVCGDDPVAPGGLHSVSNIFRVIGEKF